jgi:Reverse transcriptase (RNA-dependent DNA polymerase)
MKMKRNQMKAKRKLMKMTDRRKSSLLQSIHQLHQIQENHQHLKKQSFAPVASDTGIRVVIGVFLYYLHQKPEDNWVLESFDVEAAFLDAVLTHPVYIEWQKDIKEFGLLKEFECKTTCAELTRAMYGNIDSPLQWMRTFANILTGDDMKLKQSATDPCIFYKQRKGKLVLVLVLFVHDTLCTGEKREVEWAYKMIESKVKIEKLGRVKKHLGIWYGWKNDELGNTYLEATMPKMIEEISVKFEKATGNKAKAYATPGNPGKTLRKNEGAIELDAYRSIVGKIMYYATKHWRALERCVGYLTSQGTQALCLRKPRELRSISDCDSDYAKDENERKSISGRINTLGGRTTN